MTKGNDAPTLIYATNPMCAWCYGFTAVIRRLKALWQGRVNVQVLFGNLNAYAQSPLLQEEKERLAVSWHRVQEKSYLPFDYSFFKRDSFTYDTEPACRAMLCVRLLRPVLTLEVLRAMHSAFFVDNQDLKNPEVLIHIVGLFGISENLFLTLFESEEIQQQLDDEFGYVDDIGATTFPSVFLVTSRGAKQLTEGYCDMYDLEHRIYNTINNH